MYSVKSIFINHYFILFYMIYIIYVCEGVFGHVCIVYVVVFTLIQF